MNTGLTGEAQKGPGAVVEPGQCLKHRPSSVGNDIAGNRISCKPQKLQGMSARVKIGRGSWRQVGQKYPGLYIFGLL
jgi:hypothetical protein